MSWPSCAAGPVMAADCPRTIWESVTPCAAAGIASASASMARMVRIMGSSFGPLVSGPRCIIPPGSGRRHPRGYKCHLAGEELADLLHEAAGARVVAAAVLVV